jgi:hypothetical protein
MNYRLFFLLAAFSLTASAQNWSSFLDQSRAVDWSNAGFTIPNYTTSCSVQPKLSTGSGAASANSSAIQNALASCDATHNVVNIPAGTWYTNGWVMDGTSHAVVRGAGASSTYIYLQNDACGGSQNAGVCLESADNTYDGSDSVLPSGAHQCSWTGGLSQGSKTLTLSNCGSAPPINNILILDQANDTSDTGGVYLCDGNVAGCNYEGGLNGNGRIISGKEHSQAQITYITGVTSNGGGSYSVTVATPVYFNNIRSAQSPGAWWFTNGVQVGVENLTLDGTNSSGDHNMNIYNCYQCWVKGVRSINPLKDHIFIGQSAQSVVRDSYFFQSQNHASTSYAVEFEIGSGNLVENNIFQQTTNPLMFGAGTGNVIAYNFEINDVTSNLYSLQTSYASHNTGNNFNLWEGNNQIGVWTDDAWGSSANDTIYRNLLTGWQGGGYSTNFIPIQVRTYHRGFNVIGNVLGHPGSQNQYQAIATSSSGGTGASDSGTSIYELGWADISGPGSCGTGASSSPACDAKVGSTLMRWGNWDSVNGATRWDATEASPAAATYLGANFTSSYFSSLAHTLPASLLHPTTPSWWPSGKNWPPIGPDVSTGNVGVCSGNYSGYQGTASGQCSGGALSAAWASHVTSIPAQDCFLNVMHGAPNGSGNVLSFDASQCYSSSSSSTSGSGPGSPTGLTAIVQ